MARSAAQEFKEAALRQLPTVTGVYALCDLDRVPVYVGQSTDGIRARVRRHLTSARSDVIANRQIDVWEVAYVWAWPLDRAAGEPSIPSVQCSVAFGQWNDSARTSGFGV